MNKTFWVCMLVIVGILMWSSAMYFLYVVWYRPGLNLGAVNTLTAEVQKENNEEQNALNDWFLCTGSCNFNIRRWNYMNTLNMTEEVEKEMNESLECHIKCREEYEKTVSLKIICPTEEFPKDHSEGDVWLYALFLDWETYCGENSKYDCDLEVN